SAFNIRSQRDNRCAIEPRCAHGEQEGREEMRILSAFARLFLFLLHQVHRSHHFSRSRAAASTSAMGTSATTEAEWRQGASWMKCASQIGQVSRHEIAGQWRARKNGP